jgi:hypothetical protein
VDEAVLGEADLDQPITAITPAKGGIRSPASHLVLQIETQKTLNLFVSYKYSMAESVDLLATASCNSVEAVKFRGVFFRL